MVKLETHHVVADRSSHIVDQTCGLASTDFLHRLGFSLILTCVHEATGQPNIKPDRPARGFGQPSTPWAHRSAAFAHYLLMLGTFTG
jgi:hypothetical protein